MEICKNICPNCKIIKTRNSHFDAVQIDLEFMDIENDIELALKDPSTFILTGDYPKAGWNK
jgi:hypothetical protein